MTEINKHRLDYTVNFEKTESSEMIDKNAQFCKPYGFDDKLNDIKRKIAQLKARTNHN